MLSRVAESLYWMARNVERAEDLARLLDVTATRSFDRLEDALPRWQAIYTVAGITPPENAADRLQTVDDVVFDTTSRFSIAASVRIARQNAVGVRAELTTEVWECINGLYLFVEAQSARAVGPDGTSTFLRSVRDTAQAFGGICDATLAHDDAWEFLRIGRFLERARMTSRILRAVEDDDVAPHVWQLTLEACCASSPFARARRQSADPVEALAFLALSPVFPRSLRFCVREIDAALHMLSGAPAGTFADNAERHSGRIAASLDFAGPFDLVREGARPFAVRLAAQLDELGSAIVSTYFPAVPVG
ncbi:MAG TPA: alpha-E domain-containing protein [Candidatus Sulfotelmatobacter sp.]|nr:alpha-E domain-containing protein [Candidatus Sulfotelmatobacter sp.]